MRQLSLKLPYPTMHPSAHALALMLVRVPDEDDDEPFDYGPACEAIEDLFNTSMCDEQKCDLFALLAENVAEFQPFAEKVQVVSDCLWDNEQWWAKRYG
jgi:hypothetical protein